MAADGEQKPIDRVFAELKARRLVAAKTKLKRKPADWWYDFAGAKRVIYYNERYSSLKDNPLRLALSHEQYHLVNRKTLTRLRAFYVACFVIVALPISRYLGTLALVLMPVVLAALWPASLWVFGAAIRADETKADLHAAKTLIGIFEIEKPSVTAVSLFKTLRERPRDRTRLTYRIRQFFYEGLHPADEERIKAIQEYEESIAKRADADGNTLH
jgi:Zn-dependent protease with chaperone function